MKNFKSLFHRMGALALSALLLLGAAQTVTAADTVSLDFSKSGSSSITVRLVNDSQEAVKDGTLTLYQVADLILDDGNMAYTFTDAFAACGLDLKEITESEAALAGAADTLASYVNSKGLSGTAMVNTTGSVTFTGLPLGLYLIVQTVTSDGYETISPFMVTVPLKQDDAWVYDVDASPKVESLTAVPETPQEDTPQETAGESAEPVSGTVTASSITLAQTGQLNWPIPVLAVCGLLLFTAGAFLTGKRKNC